MACMYQLAKKTNHNFQLCGKFMVGTGKLMVCECIVNKTISSSCLPCSEVSMC